ncbi:MULTISPECIES: hypothetical protein [unclassified Novosphingobium]|nr:MULTISPECIES: hypothetical protein [unclassified Novosphingobium]NMN85304.1 hypothetical protein [Novosphingobium sp. SG916]
MDIIADLPLRFVGDHVASPLASVARIAMKWGIANNGRLGFARAVRGF